MGTSEKRRKQESESFEEITGTVTNDSATKRDRWSTAFLMAGSAILGATAVAFWNRRTIAKIRAQLLAESAQPRPRVQQNEEIF